MGKLEVVMIAHDLSFNLLWTKFGTDSFGMQLITAVSDTLARKQVCLMLHHSCQQSGGVVMHCSFPQPCVSVAVPHVAGMIKALTHSPQANTAQSSILSGVSGLLPDCPPDC